MLRNFALRRLPVIVAASLLIFAAKPAATRAGISVDAAQRDFKIMNAIFARSHATAFKQIPARDAPDIFQGSELISLSQFMSGVLGYYGRLHVDHTMVGIPPDIIDAFGLKTRFFPFPLRFIDSRAYFDVKYKDIPFGAELTHINGKTVGDIVQSFGEFPRTRSGDVFWDSYYLTEQFSSWFFLTNNGSAPWKLKYQSGNPTKATEVFIDENLNPAVFKRVSSDREYFKPVLHSMFQAPRKLGYFAINSFMPAGSPYQSLEKWMEHFGQFNNESRRLGIKTLILDLRMNRGGVMPLAAASAGWFTEKPITDMSHSSVHTRLLPYREFAVAINGQKAAAGDFDNLEKKLQAEFSDQSRDGYFATRESDARYVTVTPIQNIHRFDKIYVLIGPSTYSAAVYFARLIKLAHSNVVLVGSETGSPGDGHAAETLITYRLPESGIFFDVPLARVRFAPLIKGQKPGRGLMPDIKIVESREDFLSGRDGVFETLLQSLAAP